MSASNGEGSMIFEQKDTMKVRIGPPSLLLDTDLHYYEFAEVIAVPKGQRVIFTFEDSGTFTIVRETLK